MKRLLAWEHAHSGQEPPVRAICAEDRSIVFVTVRRGLFEALAEDDGGS